MSNDLKASWDRLCDTLKESADYIFDPVVISHLDPGIGNWIALGGCPQGGITYRWNNSDTVAVPNLRLMAMSDVEVRLHPDTPRRSTPKAAANSKLSVVATPCAASPDK